ncbi:MAG: ketose-bisphosphate aldolase [Clostridia bacterium]|nr:ketose-bisphosphate aldolase [Clostridia bacterium]
MKSLKTYFLDSLKKGYCLGAYNFVNFETLKGIFEGCKKTNSPALACVSEGAIKYLGERTVKALFDSLKKEYNLPIFLHLDHGKSFEICKKAVDLGFDSVMIDGSSLPYAENVKLTKKVVSYAHKKGVLVEAELGVLAGIEDTVSAEKNIFTNPEQAYDFVSKTQCDTLAVAIGTSHGAYKFKGEQKLRFDILKQIQTLLPKTPLVLHGASSVPEKYVATINNFGGSLEGAQGVQEKLLSKCAQKFNICKINTDTDIRLAYFATLRQHFVENPKNFDLRNPNKLAIQEISELVAHKNIKIFGCKDKI